jgi:type IV secretory pathway TraG/TraD family ATPase VirD4
MTSRPAWLSQDPMWSNASRQLLVGLMIYLKSSRGTDWGWLELRDLLSLPQPKLLEIMKRWHPEAERSVEKASVTTAGILINLASFCSSIFDLAEAWGSVPPERRVSFVEWIQGRSEHKQIILQGHGAYAELTKSYVESIVGVVSAMVNSVEMTDDPNRKIWFIADEFAQMGKAPVRALFEVGRSRGVRCVIACQDFAQIEEIYGAPMVKALIGMCGTLLRGLGPHGRRLGRRPSSFHGRRGL